MEDLNRITGIATDLAFRIHSALGPGLLESVYQKILARDLIRVGCDVKVQQWVSFEFEGMRFENAFRADLVINNAVVVEVKSVQSLDPVHMKQLLTYLRLLDMRVGLVLNFGAPLMKDGIKRVVNGL